jgi:hypothetical protein
MSFSINRRWVVFCEAASSHPPSVRTAMLVFTLVLRRFRRRAPLSTVPFAWISATSGVTNPPNTGPEVCAGVVRFLPTSVRPCTSPNCLARLCHRYLRSQPSACCLAASSDGSGDAKLVMVPFTAIATSSSSFTTPIR